MKKIVDDVRAKIEMKHGSGPGFALDTKVLMADKTVKEIKDIKVGDVVCGDDNTVRTVMSVEFGEGMMCLVKQSKGDEYVVGLGHVLMLRATGITPFIGFTKHKYKLTYVIKCENVICIDSCSKKGIKQRKREFHTEKDAIEKKEMLLEGNFDPNYVKEGDMFDITVHDYFNICAKDIRKNHLKGIKTSYPVFNINNNELPVDPYFLGIWLGDGNADRVAISSIDPEIEEYLHELISKFEGMTIIKTTTEAGFVGSTGYKSTQDIHRFTLSCNERYKNPIKNALNTLGILNNKHIPDIYMNASENERFKLLAGLIDTDGYFHKNNKTNDNKTCMYYTFSQSETHKKLVFQVYKLAQSLGLRVSKMYTSTKTPPGKEAEFKDGQLTHVHYIFKISGEHIRKIPCLIDRKKASNANKDYNFVSSVANGIQVMKIDEPQKYVKFNVDNNHIFLLSDCTVVHDCTSI